MSVFWFGLSNEPIKHLPTKVTAPDSVLWKFNNFVLVLHIVCVDYRVLS